MLNEKERLFNMSGVALHRFDSAILSLCQTSNKFSKSAARHEVKESLLTHGVEFLFVGLQNGTLACQSIHELLKVISV